MQVAARLVVTRLPLDHSDLHAFNLTSTMSGAGVNTPLLDTIEPDEPSGAPQPQPEGSTLRPVVLTPTSRAAERYASTPADAESGASGNRLGRSEFFLTSARLRPQVFRGS